MPNNKTKAITLRFTEDELAELKRRAEEANLNVSQYILEKALGTSKRQPTSSMAR